jgi:hypothetical protein
VSLLDVINKAKANAIRLAGQNPLIRDVVRLSNRIPIQVNPFRTSQPTTQLGKLGKNLNPLNPANAGAAAASALLSEFARRNLSPEDAQRVEYFGFGVLPGLALNVLDAGGVNASEANELEKVKQQYLQGQLARRNAVDQVVSSGSTPPPAAGNRVDAATPQLGARTIPAPQSPVIPQISDTALAAARSEFEAPVGVPLHQFYSAQSQLGREMEATGELQRRLKEAGGAAGMADKALMTWAQKNPGLAFREMMKREGRLRADVSAD